MILDPISIATGGYVGTGPAFGDYCPLPLAIGSDGYIRFEVTPPTEDRVGGAGGHGAVVVEYSPQRGRDTETDELLALALCAIEAWYY